jgi:hypothetical protein
MHQPQPVQFSFSMIMLPFTDWNRAFRGQAATHAGVSQNLHVTAMLFIWFSRITRMRDLVGLKARSLPKEQAYSHTWQPTHFSGSADMNFLS